MPATSSTKAPAGSRKERIAWLQREKLTIILKGILYVKPPMNTSRRGGVGIGTRVQKSFRTKFQGHNKRPTGFGIKLNEHGLTPIAIIRTRIQMKRRMNLQDITTRRLLPVVAASIQTELDKPSRK